jgi:hypothetical protein
MLTRITNDFYIDLTDIKTILFVPQGSLYYEIFFHYHGNISSETYSNCDLDQTTCAKDVINKYLENKKKEF